MSNERINAIFKGLIITFLWSSSYILTKFGLQDVPPLSLVGLRYIIASIILIPIAFYKGEHLRITGYLWKLAFIGFLGYTIAQGLQCVWLFYLPSVTVTLLLNFIPVTVLILNFILTKRSPNRIQIMGMMLVIIGVYLFFKDSQGSRAHSDYYLRA
jgi:drug/metabolite transporter (DMT)-like permease